MKILPLAAFVPAPTLETPASRSAMTPGSFQILVVGR